MFALTRYSRRTALGLLALGFTAAIVLVLPVLSYAHTTLRLYHAPWVPRTLQARFVIWNYTVESARANPFFGIGAHGTKYWRVRAAPPPMAKDHWQPPTVDNHAHNFFLQVWFELGALGSLLFALAGLATLSTVARMNAHAQPYAAAAAGVAITVCSATWNLWHLWLVATLGIGMALLALGNGLATSSRIGTVSFREVWLPARLNRGLTKLH